MIIYKITNNINDKFYIGKTIKTADERFKRHFYNHKTQNTYLYKAMRKYGFENFSIEIIEETRNLDEREKFWISTLLPQYNMTSGGDGGDTSNSPNYISSIKKRDNSGSKNPMYGRKRSDTAVFLLAARDKMISTNRCPVVCEGKEYASVGEAQKVYPGISIRKRLDNPKYPKFYRLREKTLRKLSFAQQQSNTQLPYQGSERYHANKH
jgi:group I intron endonuclease